MKHWILALVAIGVFSAPLRADDADKLAFFEAKIRPVLVDNCLKCHGETKANGKLRLDSKMAMLKGGITGPAIVPGNAKSSLLIKAIRQVDPELTMPSKEKKLPDNVIADFERWIDQGAFDPRDGKQPAVADGIDWKKARQFWSFQPPKMPELPAVKNMAWAKTPIDRFILAKLEAEKLTPVRPASKRELIRRATFDLTGLPPTPEEVEAYLNDTASPQAAFAKVIDRLLASPHYGERWGRYWLDVARYAEDQAHTFAVIPNTNAWRYRDWVINALNEDMPYDRFVKLQIAADLIEKDDEGRIKHLPALGLFGLGAQYYKNTDAAKAAADELDDRVDTLTRGLLGLTVSCARCHDHKFDPIPQVDYYSLAGIFTSCKISNVPLGDAVKVKRMEETQAQIKKLDTEVKDFLKKEKAQRAAAKVDELPKYLLAAWKVQAAKQKKTAVAEIAKAEMLDQATLNRCVKFVDKAPSGFEMMRKPSAAEQEVRVAATTMQKQVRAMISQKGKLDKMKQTLLNDLFYNDNSVFQLSDTQVRALLPEEKLKKLDDMSATLTKLQKSDDAKPLPIAHGLAETNPTNMKVFLRGNPAKLGDEAPRRFLKILAGDEPARFTQGSGRLELASAIASKDNPLTARVIVNRVWQYHFGKALVATPSNFGSLGEKPTHPELLDYLAVRFSSPRPTGGEGPGVRGLGWSFKQLHREIMLSSVYQLSAERDEKNFAQDGDNRWLWRQNRRRLDVESWRDAMLAASGKLDPKLGGPTTNLAAVDNNRRTVYAKISRHDLNYLLRLFDFPDANITSERRTETTVPQQQLFVLNSPFVIETSKALAARVQKEGPSDAERVQRAFALVYGRPASGDEAQLFETFLQGQDAEPTANRLNRWERVAQILIGSNEFMYVD